VADHNVKDVELLACVIQVNSL